VGKATTSDEPLLDLDTLIKRPTILIDRKRYDILSPEELSIEDSHRFMVWGKRIEKLDSPDAGEEAGAELDRIFAEVATKVMIGVPDDVQAKLTGAHKRQVAEVFTGLLLGHKAGAVAAIASAIGAPMGFKPNLSIGGSSFPSSSASTEDNQAGGSEKPQSR